MATLREVVRDIKNVKIQGATAIAIAALKAWMQAKDKVRATKLLISARPTEPLLFHAIAAANAGQDPQELIERLIADKKRIVKYGAELIKNNMVVFTHCHSSTVVDILKEAKKEGKNFEVRNTETRPLFQGRITSKELAKAGIKVKHYVDSAAMEAMRGAHIFLFGADAITKEGVYNKIGTRMFAEIAVTYFKIPTYSCAHSWKFSKEKIIVEERPKSEVWRNAPKGIEIYNPAFELVERKFIKGVVSQLGIFSFNKFLKEVIK